MKLFAAANFKRFLCSSFKYYHYKAVLVRFFDIAKKLFANDLVNHKVPINPCCGREQLKDVFAIPLSVINPVIFKNFFDGVFLPRFQFGFGLHSGSKQQGEEGQYKSHSKYLLKQSNEARVFNQRNRVFTTMRGAHG
ncbi:hypothetical protein [Pseudovibrio sp. WM33]|uniref:hypothetical protein n=1 Tax=Pseudovibrio sp. WM33 TaxID=1735585 RepID=UPI0007B2715A|nr:hypothetical protein [Pseudovibrio sp. WM33]KZL29432.1 hypothetical protein PsWM33_00007 [Pseudovibrio sp. WM33]